MHRRPLSRPQPRARRRPSLLFVCAAVVALPVLFGTAACSGSDRSSSSVASAPGQAEGGAAGDSGAAGGGIAGNEPAPMASPAAPERNATAVSDQAGKNAAGSTTPVNPASVANLQIIKTADVTIEVKALETSAARVRAVAQSLGGTVSSEVTSYPGAPETPIPAVQSSDGSKTATARPGESVLVLRIPVATLDQALDRVGSVGTVLSRTSSAQDVTADIADVSSRVKTQQASVERVRQLLAKATSLQDIVLLESELTRRQADLEALEARRASLADRAALSTLTVTLRTPEVKVDEGNDNGFLAGLRQGWKAVIASTTMIITVLGALLPIAVVVAVVGVPLWLLIRRRRPRRSTTAPTAPTPTASTAPTAPTPSASSDATPPPGP